VGQAAGSKQKVLIVEDDLSILMGLSMNLRYEGFEVVQAQDGEAGLQLALDSAPDVVVLDVMLPRMNGFEVCKEIRRRGQKMAIVMLSAKGQESDKIMGLDLGADDYVAKPFGLKELLARIKAVLRRKGGERDDGPFRFGDVAVDFASQTVQRLGQPVPMTAQEFKLLRYFIDHGGKVLTREALIEGAWGYGYEGTARTVDNFIRQLRLKLEIDAESPAHFITVRGSGYRFVA
jgi:two-component system, OmpR family, alkaline phosphatase synthesis response regulator PhoP